MLSNKDAMNGLEHSLAEIDERLRELAPQFSRNMFREVVRDEVNELLDQRNLVTEMLGELSTEELVEES